MAKTKHDLMKDASEIVHYDSAGIPLYVKSDSLSEYPGMRALCHWHDDLEFIRSREGGMYYRIGSRTVLLKEGDCLIVNSRQMHYGYSRSREECRFLCILVHPRLFSANRTLYDRYIRPFIKNEQAGFNRRSGSARDKAPAMNSRSSGSCISFLGASSPADFSVLPQTRRPHSPGRIRTALPSAPWSPISSRIIQAGSPWTISPPRGMSAGANAAASSATGSSRLPLIFSISTGSRSAGVCCWRTDSV